VTEVDLAGHNRAVVPSAFPIQPREIKTMKMEHSVE
jgi:hypothetical protein